MTAGCLGACGPPAQCHRLTPSPSPTLATRYSPGTIIRDATSWITGRGRTPRPVAKGRVSVNPIARAATDAKMHTAQELQEQAAAKEVRAAGARGAAAGMQTGCLRVCLTARHTFAAGSWAGSPPPCLAAGCCLHVALQLQLQLLVCCCVCNMHPHLLLLTAHHPCTHPLHPQSDERTRVVYIDQAQQRETGRAFESNRVVTSKYNFITFLPIFLFEMFSRVAYLYFLLQARRAEGWWWAVQCSGRTAAMRSRCRAPLLVLHAQPAALGAAAPPSRRASTHSALCVCRAPQACLSWWSVISPFSGYGSTAALVFVLAVAAVKAIWEDVKRHHEDKRMNTSITHRVNPDGAHVAVASWVLAQMLSGPYRTKAGGASRAPGPACVC